MANKTSLVAEHIGSGRAPAPGIAGIPMKVSVPVKHGRRLYMEVRTCCIFSAVLFASTVFVWIPVNRQVHMK